MSKRILYIIINLSILGAIFFGIFVSKDAIVDIFRKAGSSVSVDGKALNFGIGIEKEIAETKEEIANKFPPLEGLSEKSFKWQYKGKNYAISQNLYNSAYEFYKSQPKTYTYFKELPTNWEEEYYGMFLSKNEKYNFAKEIIDAINKDAQKNKLSEDEIVELVLTFVQAIPYDDEKAAKILSKSGSETMNYPYETLFEGKGVCSDKSFLTTVLLREMGYGTAIFVYNDQNHMAIGIQCPMKYSNYDSGYCYAETTSLGNKIGIIPELKAYAGKAVGGEEISQIGNGITQLQQTTKLGTVRIFQQTKGKEYGGIVNTMQVNKEIVSLKSILGTLGKEIEETKADLDERLEALNEMNAKLERYVKSGDMERYNEKAEDYNDALKKYSKLAEDYNDKVKDYNKKVARYNYLIKL